MTIDVSVVIPTYNSETFLKRSVLSALAQDGITVEVIVIDDGSKDFTRDILDLIVADNPSARIKTIYFEANKGQASARNAGLDAAEGRYVAMLDSDDGFASNEVLRCWTKEADAGSLDMSIARFYNLDRSLTRRPARAIDLEQGGVYSVATAPKLVNVVSCWQILYRRDFLNANQIRFSSKLRQREDRLFVMEALLVADRVGVSGLFALDHYDVETSTMKQIDAGQLQQFVQHLTELNAAFERARAAGRSCPDFERASAIIYLRQLDTYWAGICRRLSNYQRFRPLISAYFEQMRVMVQTLPALYTDQVLDTLGQDGFLAEGRMDVLRLALKHGDEARLVDLLRVQRPGIADLWPLRSVDDTAQEVIARAWSFRRRPVHVEKSKSPLAELAGRIVLHTGLPKTGSSSLQHVLERNRIALIDQGTHYPVIGTNREFGIRRERTPGHATLIQSLLENPGQAIQELADELRQIRDLTGRRVETVLLSAENIVSQRFWNNGQDFGKIVRAFAGVPVEVVCVLRHPLNWASSLYVEMSGNPWNTFSLSFDQYVADLAGLGLLDYAAIESRLSATPGVTAFHLGCFEHIRDNGGIEPWFFEKFGIDAAAFAAVPRHLTNESQTPAQAAVIRQFKRFEKFDRQEMAKLFLAVEDDSDLKIDKAPTASMLAGLGRLAQGHASTIADYESRHGVSPRLPSQGSGFDLESAIDRHLAALIEAKARPEQKSIEKLLVSFDKSMASLNAGRILRVGREDRRQSIWIDLEPGETAEYATVVMPDRTAELGLFRWEGRALTLVDPQYLADLWHSGQRDLEIEIVTNQRTGRRPFTIIRFNADESFWLAPPLYVEKYKEKGAWT